MFELSAFGQQLNYQAVLQLMTHFHDFKSIETIYQLSQNVEGFKKMLLDQIFADFNVWSVLLARVHTAN